VGVTGNVSPRPLPHRAWKTMPNFPALATGFAARRLTIVPGVPEHDCGPEICLGPNQLGLPGFLELASKLGGGLLYLRAVLFDLDAVNGDQPDEPPAHLIA
jgi:hypothetical protein